MMQSGTYLASLVKAKSAWTHFWKDVDFEGSGAHAAALGAELDNGQLPAGVARTVSATDSVVKSLQASLDRSSAALSGLKRTIGKGAGKNGQSLNQQQQHLQQQGGNNNQPQAPRGPRNAAAKRRGRRAGDSNQDGRRVNLQT